MKKVKNETKTVELYEVLERQEKKFSFIVPVYKTEETLEASLKSLLNQDYKNIEIIVVADGESKKAEKIVRALQKEDKRIVKYMTIEHGGAPKARNAGAKVAIGDYISFFDSDCELEIGATRVWAKSFLTYPEIGFSYAGYRFNNGMFLESEDFNAYLLTCYNYIATMFPMKREIFPGFDENLKSLQDWDMWIRIVKAGHKGWKNEGSAFTADATRKGISAEGCAKDTWISRWQAVKDKNSIHRDCAFISTVHKYRAIELAEYFGWDYLDSSRFHLNYDYKTVYCIGFYFKHMQTLAQGFNTCPKGTTKILHFMGEDVEGLHCVPHKILKELVITLNNTINVFYCENEICRKMLEEVGIKAEVQALPMNYTETPMSKTFNVYYETDQVSSEIVEQVKKSCPDILFESPDYADLKSYACLLSITGGSEMPSENLKRFLAAGRFVVTNYSLLYANKTEIKVDKIINSIREAKKSWKKGEVNVKAQDYYKKLISIDIFKSKVIEGVINGKSISSNACISGANVSGLLH